MDPFWVGVALIGAFAIGLLFGWWGSKVLTEQRLRDQALTLQLEGALRRVLAAQRTISGMSEDQPRYEIRLDDWGSAYPERDMRFRWTIWDADWALVTEVDPEHSEIGVEKPVMLGNAPTMGAALKEAVTWVLDEGGVDAMVVFPGAGAQ